MQTASLDDYLALNEQLAALVDAGVPLEVGFGLPAGSAAKSLEKIQATVARRVSRGESLAEALEGDEQDVPPAYRSLVQLGLHKGNLSAALDGSNRVAAAVDESRVMLGAAFVYPLIVCWLVYAGMVGLCLYFVPTFAGMYESLQVAPGPGLSVLQALRNTLPYWATVVPILLVVLALWAIRSNWRRSAGGGAHSAGLFGWLPGMSETLFQERCARFATLLSELLVEGVSLDESLRIAADGSGDRDLAAGARQLAAEVEAGELPNDASTAARRFPPFLRWALWHAEAALGRVRALEIAARLYRETAQRRSEQLRTVAPMVALVLVGGTVTLLYGLALFVPMIELLQTLAR